MACGVAILLTPREQGFFLGSIGLNRADLRRRLDAERRPLRMLPEPGDPLGLAL
jgi:hypothetical protein